MFAAFIFFLITSTLPCNSAKKGDVQGLAGKNKRIKEALAGLPGDIKTRLEIGGANALKNISRETMKKLPTKLLANMGRDALQSMTREQLKELDKKIGKGGTSTKDLKTILGDLRADQFDDMLEDMQNSTRKLSRSQKEAFVKQMRQSKGRPSSWSANDVRKLGTMATGLAPSELRDLANAGRSAFEASVDELGKAGASLSKGQAKELLKGAKKVFGGQENWNADTVRKMAKFMPRMKKKELDKLSPSAIKGAIDDLASSSLDEKSARQLMKKLKDSQGYGAPSSWTADTLRKMGNLTSGLTLKDIDNLNSEAVKNSLGSLGQAKLSKKQARKLARKVKDALGSVNTWSADTIRNASSLLRGLKPKDLRNLHPDAVKDAIRDIKKVKFSRGQAREIAKKLKDSLGNPSSWNATTAEEMGPLVGGLPLTDLKSMSNAALRSAFKSLKSDDSIPPAKKRAILKKAKAAGDLKLVEVGSFIKAYSLKDLENIDIDADLGLMNTTTNATDDANRQALPWKLSQARKVLRKIRDRWGDPADSGSKWTLENIGRLEGLAIGIWKDLVAGMPVEDFSDIVEEFAGRGGFTPGQRKMIMREFRRKLYLDIPSNFSSVTEEMMAPLGNLTAELTEDELVELPVDASDVALQQRGEADISGQPRGLVEKKARIALKLLGKSRGLVTSVDPSELTSTEIEDMGNLVVGLTSDDIDDLDTDAFKAAVISIGQRKGFDKEQLKRLGRKAKEAYKGSGSADDAPSLLSDTDIYDLGNIMAGFSKEDFEKMTTERVSSHIDYLGTLPLDRDQAKALMERNIRAKRKRRKADLAGKTGDELIAMGNTLLGLTVDDIATVNAISYDEAALTIGAISGFSLEQLQAWAARAKAAWGSDASQFTSEWLLKLGVVAIGFTADELGQMNLNSDDIIESLGSQSLQTSDTVGYTTQQLSKAFNKIKSLKGKQMSGFTGDELAALGTFALAMTTAEISSIGTSAFATAASSLGGQTGWSEAQMAKLKERAETVYGAVSTWTGAELREAGAAIGGMTVTELQSISADNMNMIKTSAIPQIPPSLFKEFSTTQLQGLDPTQAASVTDDQMDALPADKRALLNDITGTITVRDSGTEQLKMNLVLLFTVSLVTPLLRYQEAVAHWIARTLIHIF